MLITNLSKQPNNFLQCCLCQTFGTSSPISLYLRRRAQINLQLCGRFRFHITKASVLQMTITDFMNPPTQMTIIADLHIRCKLANWKDRQKGKRIGGKVTVWCKFGWVNCLNCMDFQWFNSRTWLVSIPTLFKSVLPAWLHHRPNGWKKNWNVWFFICLNCGVGLPCALLRS